MENFNLLRKDFRILIIEDEEFARLQLGKFFKRIFNNVTLCENGLEGLQKFQEAYYKDKKIDLIISDINMPKLDGLDMLEKIRDIDNDVPTIFLTARNEPEKIIKAINLHVNDYILKPLDLVILNDKITKVTKDIYYQKIYDKQKRELESYVEILEKEALVRKVNLEGKVTFVNDGYCELFAYEKEDLIEEHFHKTIHNDMSSSFLTELWESVLAGNIWNGKYKCLSNDNMVYFLNSKIIPIYDLDKTTIIELMFIEFSITDEELKNREKHKNFITQVLEYKKVISILRNENTQLNNELKEGTLDLPFLKDELEVEKNKSLNKERQINHYELQMHNIDEKYQIRLNTKAKEIEMHIKTIQTKKQKNEVLFNKNKNLEDEMVVIKDEMFKLIEINEKKTKKLKDLKDIIKDMEEKAK